MQNLNLKQDSGEYTGIHTDSTVRKSPRFHPEDTHIDFKNKEGIGETQLNKEQEPTLDTLKNRLTEYMKKRRLSKKKDKQKLRHATRQSNRKYGTWDKISTRSKNKIRNNNIMINNTT